MTETWIDAGPVAALQEGEAVPVAVGDRLVAVVCSQGKLYAIEDLCTHDGGELVGGIVSDGEIVCPRHGARFCLRTGQAMSPPAYEPTRVFETKVASEHLWIRAD